MALQKKFADPLICQLHNVPTQGMHLTQSCVLTELYSLLLHWTQSSGFEKNIWASKLGTLGSQSWEGHPGSSSPSLQVGTFLTREGGTWPRSQRKSQDVGLLDYLLASPGWGEADLLPAPPFLQPQLGPPLSHVLPCASHSSIVLVYCAGRGPGTFSNRLPGGTARLESKSTR